MYKNFAVLTACAATSAIFLAVAQAADVKSSNAEGQITDRSAHCEAQAATLQLAGDTKDSFVSKCVAPFSSAQRSAARKVQGSKPD
jgi:hypothetical protein